MKKIAILSVAFLLAMSVTMGQTQNTAMVKKTEPKKEMKTEREPLRKLEGKIIPERVRTSFYEDFGEVPDVAWNRETNFDVATFTKSGQKLNAFYDYDGKLVGTTSAKTFSDLPARAQQEITARYKDYSIGPVVYFDDNDINITDMSLWDTQFDDEDNYFVELAKENHKIIVRVDPRGDLFYFKQLK